MELTKLVVEMECISAGAPHQVGGVAVVRYPALNVLPPMIFSWVALG